MPGKMEIGRCTAEEGLSLYELGILLQIVSNIVCVGDEDVVVLDSSVVAGPVVTGVVLTIIERSVKPVAGTVVVTIVDRCVEAIAHHFNGLGINSVESSSVGGENTVLKLGDISEGKHDRLSLDIRYGCRRDESQVAGRKNQSHRRGDQ